MAYHLLIMDILYLVALNQFKASQSRGFFRNEAFSLPPLKQNPENFYDAGFNEGVEVCRRHINAQEIKTK